MAVIKYPMNDWRKNTTHDELLTCTLYMFQRSQSLLHRRYEQEMLGPEYEILILGMQSALTCTTAVSHSEIAC